jgi:hypothetical protein
VPSSAKNKSRPISSVAPSSRRSPRRKQRRKFGSSAVEFLYDRYVGKNPKQAEAFDPEVLSAELAGKIFERTLAGLSQRQFGEPRRNLGLGHLPAEDADYKDIRCRS